MSHPSHSSTFPAMSTTVAVVSVGIPERHHHRAMNGIVADVEAWERRFSRFRPESMLSRVNAATGSWVTVDAPFRDLLEVARDAVFATSGRFNPAILPALEAHGYNRTIDDVRRTRPLVARQPRPPVPLDAWTEVVVDRANGRVQIPERLRIDLGGIAKGALADRLAERFAHWPGGAISIGGDMRVWGTPPDGEAWRVGIEHPLDGERDIAVATLPDGPCLAIATSSRTKRAWATGSGQAHHLIDPATGKPATSSILAVSACAPTATMAEIVTKNLMVASASAALTAELLLDACWALTVSDTLDLARITKEAA